MTFDLEASEQRLENEGEYGVQHHHLNGSPNVLHEEHHVQHQRIKADLSAAHERIRELETLWLNQRSQRMELCAECADRALHLERAISRENDANDRAASLESDLARVKAAARELLVALNGMDVTSDVGLLPAFWQFWQVVDELAAVLGEGTDHRTSKPQETINDVTLENLRRLIPGQEEHPVNETTEPVTLGMARCEPRCPDLPSWPMRSLILGTCPRCTWATDEPSAKVARAIAANRLLEGDAAPEGGSP